MRREQNIKADVNVGDGIVVIRRKSSSEVTIAQVLGIEEDGRRVYLDRLVHAPWERSLGEWICTGAISTILEIKQS